MRWTCPAARRTRRRGGVHGAVHAPGRRGGRVRLKTGGGVEEEAEDGEDADLSGDLSGWRDGELESEMAVLKQTVADGGTPSLANFNFGMLLCCKAVYKGLGMAGVHRALSLLALMDEAGVTPNQRTYDLLLDACVGAAAQGSAAGLQHGVTIIGHMCALGVRPSLVVANQLIKAMLKADGVQPQASFDSALGLVRMMQQAGVRLDVYSYNSLVSSCAMQERRGVQLALGVLEMMQANKVEPDIVTYNALINTCAKSAGHAGAPAVEQAERVLWLIRSNPKLAPSVISYNAVMHACARAACAKGEDSMSWLEEMLRVKSRMVADGILADVRSYSTMLHGVSKVMAKIAAPRRNSALVARLLSMGLALVGEMEKQGLRPNTITYNAVLEMYAKSAAVGIQRADAGQRCGPAPADSWYSEAMVVVGRMEERGLRLNEASYTALVEAASCAPRKGFDASVEVLHRMVRDGLQPGPMTYNLVFTAARRDGSSRAVEQALQIFLASDARSRSKHTYTSMMAALSSVGRWKEALLLLDSARRASVVCPPAAAPR